MYNDRRLLSSQHLKKKSNQRRKLKNFSEILAIRLNSKILSDQFKEKNIKQLLSLLNHWIIKQTFNRYHRYVKHFADKNSCLSLSTATARFTSGTRQHKICRFGKKIEDCKSFFLQGQNEVFGTVDGFDIQRWRSYVQLGGKQ